MALFVRLLAVTAGALIVLGFAMFANDQAQAGSDRQVAYLKSAVQTAAPTSAQESFREREHGNVRELIDDANDVLLAPFSGVIDSSNMWVQRLVPTVLALLLFCLLGLLIANYLPRPGRETRDWREAT